MYNPANIVWKDIHYIGIKHMNNGPIQENAYSYNKDNKTNSYSNSNNNNNDTKKEHNNDNNFQL